ncbi:hypothetical protein MOO45_00500 [Bombilactobacillus folatiphilus]|uniref:N-acetyltransferase domain-containing protein n=1 Tax=Bombilactobacillus folatiphilus TaxID=2923362 RepID=A0ABY4P9I7_9LACO|nr:hypothetical protein [Bombilactobacillus folatiphilus]UQS82209.1 hypothetical protein MOO45_00500 [Bombilactobacillus folatiphilus]
MPNLQIFHPIITAHFELNFLSYLPGQIIQTFLQTDIAQTSAFINRAMQQIMRNQAITWGVLAKKSRQLIGLITIKHFDSPQLSLTLNFKTEVPAEILTRLQQLINDQFHHQAVLVTAESTQAALSQKFFNKNLT